MALRDDIPMGYTRDSKGNVLSHRNSAGCWFEYTYDSNGNKLTYKDSDWCKKLYESSDSLYEDSELFMKTIEVNEVK